MNNQDLYNQFQQHQTQYIYFLLAIDVSAIGFAVTQTLDKQFAYSQIPLALSVLCWAFSFYNGCRFLQRKITGVWVELQHGKILELYPETSKPPPPIKATLMEYENKLTEIVKEAERIYYWFKNFLFVGF